VKHTLLNSFVQGRNRLPEDLVGRLLVAFGERLSHVAKRAPQAGTIGPIANRAFFCLTGAFQRRKMVCH
jgi:hypothetical protein